jgi:hypothetical protein
MKRVKMPTIEPPKLYDFHYLASIKLFYNNVQIHGVQHLPLIDVAYKITCGRQSIRGSLCLMQIEALDAARLHL